MNDMEVSTDAPQVDGMAAPVLSNFVVGVVVDRVRKMSSMFVGVFLLFRIPFRVVGLRRLLWWLVGTHPLRRGLYLIGNPTGLTATGGLDGIGSSLLSPGAAP